MLGGAFNGIIYSFKRLKMDNLMKFIHYVNIILNLYPQIKNDCVVMEITWGN